MSELAWSVDRKINKREKKPGFAGYAYGELSSRAKAGFEFTQPQPETEKFEQLCTLLVNSRKARDRDGAAKMVSILLEELEAPYSNKALRSAATPLGVETALLQDLRGVTGKKNPANLALNLEKMYALGGGKASVAASWTSAVMSSSGGGLPTWIRDFYAVVAPSALEAVIETVKQNGPSHAVKDLRQPKWLPRNTPYKWFASAWTNLCHSGWVDQMPRRRWTDWASCVARTALASGFMFEMHLYRRLCAALIATDDAEDAVRAIIEDSNRLFGWDDLMQKSAADVGPVIRQLADAGSSCMKLISELTLEKGSAVPTFAEFDDDENGLTAWLRAAREACKDRSGFEQDVGTALAAKKSGTANNTWETIRYSLLARSSDGEQDLYALLKSAGRYTWVEPGQEWLVTISSLQAEGPGQLSRMTDLTSALAAIGIDASQRTLVTRLENYGLARSSHDADDALEIMPGF
ncbi:hypothetical protein KUW09_24975 [Mameliella alba]|nr:hypothetical protein [Antarctobacter heliothermus]MBY6147323.1 hypothetical protein [Mameliella alba]MCA0957382.1 hypothetical protein [Mameliella alba]